ncbi:MAG: HAMP domain-containing protein [Deltaproteobacteria bacterium]|nr:HAMP domain-containing protein [Deltaproteobacteria bacterium]
MNLAFRTKLLVFSATVTIASVVAISAYLSASLRDQLTARAEQDLFVRLSLIQDRAARARIPLDNLEAWDELSDELGARAHARVTIIRRDGVVLGDSAVPQVELPRLENHSARSEVASALERGRGTSSRRSPTTGQRMLYVAEPFEDENGAIGVVRAALPLTEVDAAIRAARRALWSGASLALAVALVASLVATRRLSSSVRALTGAARKMQAGDLSARARVGSPDELGELGGALDGLASSLDRTLGELRGERDLLSGILDAMQEGVLVLGSDGRLALVNPALREMLLLSSDVVGRPPIEAVRHAELVALLGRAQAERSPMTGEIEVPGIRPRRLLVRASNLAAHPDAAQRGDARGMLVVFVDVTDLRRLESLRRDFVANVSHELRTPITAIRSASETLSDGALVDPDAAPTFLGILARNAERLQNLVEDLLDLSRIESREYQLRVEDVELAGIVVMVQEGLRPHALKREVMLLCEVPPGLPIRADRRALEQVLWNLLDNAVKHGTPGNRVVARASCSTSHVTVSIVDTGPGIAKEHLPRIFERFYRVDPGRSREQGGTGLGLAIVKHLVEAMGGSICVESTVGVGSTFSFSLPSGVL